VTRALLAAGGIVLAVTAPCPAQYSHAAHQAPSLPRELVERPLVLRTGVGAAHDAVTTTSPQAQAFYDQGFAYLHSFLGGRQ